MMRACLFTVSGILTAILLSVAGDLQGLEFPEPYFPAPYRLKAEKVPGVLKQLDEAMALSRRGELPGAPDQFAYYVAHREYNGLILDCQYVLRYDNPEIREKLLDLYLEECARYPTPEGRHLHVGEDSGDYLWILMTMAESTFSPRIYDTVLKPPEPAGQLRELYLATVNADRNLEILLSATLGERLGVKSVPDSFYCADDGHPLFSLQRAFLVLSLMCDRSPQTVKRNRQGVMEFVKAHVKYYASPREYKGKPRPPLPWHDLTVRDRALDVLLLLGKPGDLPFIEEIVRWIPVGEIHPTRQAEAQEKVGKLRIKAREITRIVDEREYQE